MIAVKTVFILGAGASYDAGVPLMAGFLDKADRLTRGLNDAAAIDVFTAISELQGVYAKAHLDLDNIEALFGAIEMAGLIGRLANRSPESITGLRASLINLIVHTIEQSSFFPVSKEGGQTAAKPYPEFIEMLKLVSETVQSEERMQFAFLTFNYDVVLDHALTTYGVAYSYYLDPNEPHDRIPVLKLHGSINWGVCPECKTTVPYPISQARIRPIRSDTRNVVFNIGTNIHLKEHEQCRKPLLGPPVLVPPTWNKNSYHGDLQRVWNHAAKELATANNIFVIGYSLPESDSFFRYLFALGSESKTRIKRLWIFNPDRDGTVEQRFRRMVGRGIESRLEFFKGESGLFSESISEIQRALLSEFR